MRTYVARPGEIPRTWHLVDADGKVLGRLASEVAMLLRGKRKPSFTPHEDVGDFVIVINAAKIRLTGNKLRDKVYYRYSGYPGGLKAATASKLLQEHPTRLVEQAVRGMLPKSKMGDRLYRKLKVYGGAAHPHQAQQPVAVVLG